MDERQSSGYFSRGVRKPARRLRFRYIAFVTYRIALEFVYSKKLAYIKAIWIRSFLYTHRREKDSRGPSVTLIFLNGFRRNLHGINSEACARPR